MKSFQLGDFTLQGMGGPGLPPVAGAGGVGFVEGQVVFPNSTGQLTGDPILFWNNTTKTEEIGMGGDIKLFNTVDKTVNTEFISIDWFANIARIRTSRTGTGATLPLSISAGNANPVIQLVPTSGSISYTSASSPINSIAHSFTAANASATGTNTLLSISGGINQTGTAGYTALDVNPTETGVGSGTKLLQRWAVGGIQFASITNTGNFTSTSLGTSVSNTTVGGALVSTSAATRLINATAGAVIVTLPTASSALGRMYTVKKIDASANTVTIQGNAAETIDGSNTRVLTAQYQSVTVQSDGSAWYIL